MLYVSAIAAVSRAAAVPVCIAHTARSFRARRASAYSASSESASASAKDFDGGHARPTDALGASNVVTLPELLASRFDAGRSQSAMYAAIA